MKKVIAVFVLLFLVAGGFLGYQGYEKSKQSELFSEASVYFTEKDYKKAIQLFEEAKDHKNLFAGSMDRELAYYQAEAHVNLGEYEDAIAIYDRFIGEKPKEAKNYVLKGHCYRKMKKYGEAAGVYQEAYRQTGTGEFLLNLCNMYIATKEYEKALDFIAKSKDVPKNTKKELLFCEIVIYEKQQDYQAAYRKAEEFVERYPDDKDGVKEKEFLESRQ